MNLRSAIRAGMVLAGGEFTLRRETKAAGPNAWTAGAATVEYFPCIARARGYKPNEVRGGILEHDEKISVDPTSICVEPRKDDRIAVGTWSADGGADWRHVISVYSPCDAHGVAFHKLQVRR